MNSRRTANNCAVYWACLPDRVPDAGVLACWSDLLDARELRTMERRATPLLRARFGAAHAWRRRTVADHVGCAPADVEWWTDPRGKPQLGSPLLRWSTSLTHDDQHVALALSAAAPIGVDLEQSTVASVEAPDVLSAAERRFVADCRDSERSRRFAVVWTRKEAWAKRSGVGLRAPLNHLTLVGNGPNNNFALHGCCVATFEVSSFVLSVSWVGVENSATQFTPVHRPLPAAGFDGAALIAAGQV